MLKSDILVTRMGGVQVFQLNAPDSPSFRLEFRGAWHCDMDRLNEKIENSPQYLCNYTMGHENDFNHLWHLVGKEIHTLDGEGDCDAVCVLYYRPVNPGYLREYSDKLLGLSYGTTLPVNEDKQIINYCYITPSGELVGERGTIDLEYYDTIEKIKEQFLYKRIFSHENSHIDDQGMLASIDVPTEWVGSHIVHESPTSMIIYVESSPLSDDEHDALIRKQVSCLSPNLYFGDEDCVEKFRQYMRTRGVKNSLINRIIEGWRKHLALVEKQLAEGFTFDDYGEPVAPVR